MATLHRPKNARGKVSPFWAAMLRDANGRLVNRSTRQKVLREAQKVAMAWEGAARKARAGELTQAASVKILRDLMEATTGESLKTPSIKETFETYVKNCKADGAAASTLARYRPVFARLLAHLGPVRSVASVASLNTGELEDWRRAELSTGLGGKTLNMGMGIVRAALNAAKRRGEILANPADAVKRMTEEKSDAREAFTDEEIAALVRVAEKEWKDWRGAVLTAAWTGLRLTDVAALTWGQVDLKEGTLDVTPAKTDKALLLPLSVELRDFLGGVDRGVGKAPVFPGLAGRVSGSNGGLSNEFARLMKRADVKGKAGREKVGKGRQVSTKSFHSLRHAFVSRLANADVSADVRKEMTGHDTDEAHSRYVHMKFEKQTEALAKLATLGGWR